MVLWPSSLPTVKRSTPFITAWEAKGEAPRGRNSLPNVQAWPVRPWPLPPDVQRYLQEKTMINLRTVMLLVSLFAVVVISNSGCSVFMAATQPGAKTGRFV